MHNFINFKNGIKERSKQLETFQVTEKWNIDGPSPAAKLDGTGKQ